MSTTTKLITASELKSIITIDSVTDVAWFDREILFCQEVYLKPVLTEELYYAILTDYATPPLSTENQILYDRYLKFIVANGTAFRSIVGNIETQTSNQGVEVNRTEYSNSKAIDDKRQANLLYNKVFYYQNQLGNFLINNAVDYPNFDQTQICLTPEFGYFTNI